MEMRITKAPQALFRTGATFLIALLILTLLMFFAFGCERDNSGNDGDDSDQNDDSSLDSCGYKIVEVPEGCTKCHGAPPETARHPTNNRCYRCHGNVIDENMQFVQVALHDNGTVDYAVGCTSCHGWNLGTSPPQNLKGECTPGAVGVGAHAAMRRDCIPAHKVGCNNCHDVPLTTWSAGHIDGDNKAEINFKFLAVAKGATPVWNGKTCSNVYCHGATLEGGDLKEPNWLDTSGDAGNCGACHRLTDPQGNENAVCSDCHPTTVKNNRELISDGTHINGVIDLPESTK